MSSMSTEAQVYVVWDSELRVKSVVTEIPSEPYFKVLYVIHIALNDMGRPTMTAEQASPDSVFHDICRGF